MKRVLFKPGYGVSVGAGHLIRSINLAVYFSDFFEVLFHIENDSSAQFLLEQNRVNYVSDKTIFQTIAEEKIDLLVVDQLDIESETIYQIRKTYKRLRILCLDYFDFQNGNIDAIINLFNHNSKYKGPISKAILYKEGLGYTILNKSFDNHLKNRQFSPEVKNILIAFGGSDPSNNTEKTIRFLDQHIKKTKITIVIGPFNEHSVSKPDCQLSLNILKAIPQTKMVQLLSESDLVFCGSGTTLLEAMAIGTPAVVFPQNKTELKFAQYYRNAGMAHLIEDNDIFSQKNIKAILELMSHVEHRLQSSLKGQRSIDGKGKARILSIAQELLQ